MIDILTDENKLILIDTPSYNSALENEELTYGLYNITNYT